MQKHNAWLSNRGYIQHLNVLTKIQNRRTQTQAKNNMNHTFSAPRPSYTQNSNRPEDTSTFTRSKDNITIRQQQILWDNYHLGKRIIQTPPVISKRKLDQEYRKHKRLVKCLTASNTRKVVPTDFRVKKLQQYKENVEQLSEDRAIEAATQKYFLRLQINELTFYRQKPLLDELGLSLSYHIKDQKTKKHNSETFPASELLLKHFYFAIPKRLIDSSEPLTVQIQNYKGLEKLSLGYLTFPSKIDGTFRSQLFHCGKLIGEVVTTINERKKEPTVRQSHS